jgi:hypothetical protein
MQAYLVGRVDSQLQAVAEHPIAGLASSTGGGGGHGGPDGPDDPDDGRAHLPSAFVVEVLNAGGTIVYGPTSDLVDTREPLPQLPRVTVPAGGAARSYNVTVAAVQDDGQWRVAVRPTTLSDGSAGTLLVAQSLGDVRGTVGRLAMLFAIIGAAAVAVIAGVGYLIVRASLRPLGEVERTAAAIAGGDLNRADSDVSRLQRREIRLADADPDVAAVLALCARRSSPPPADTSPPCAAAGSIRPGWSRAGPSRPPAGACASTARPTTPSTAAATCSSPAGRRPVACGRSASATRTTAGASRPP